MGNNPELEKANKEIENLNKKFTGINKKVEGLEHENAVLNDKVESYEDPANKPRIIRKGYVKQTIKFQKNTIKINPCPNPEPEPIPAK